MYIIILYNINKWFHAACAMRGRKMSKVITELVEQWLKANEVSSFSEPKS
ncbi:plasmid partition protein ParG [uncultured Nostoc sp.]